MSYEIVNVFWHEHPVHDKQIRTHVRCSGCRNSLNIRKAETYECYTCNKQWHASCVPTSPEIINHKCHPSHSLEFFFQGPPSYTDHKCSLCQWELDGVTYHCKLCDFSVDMKCVLTPPPLTVVRPKCHKQHALTLLGREVSFTCNACGTLGERNPYVCLPCSHMYHYDCIVLPHVININRHDHRVSYTSPLSPGDHICEICRKGINWRYGAYSCNKCPDNFFVHSKCAIHKYVWDGLELEGVPEEELDTSPFKVIEEGVINHFSHEEHNLFLIEDVIIEGGEDKRCEACSRTISFERYYKCMECEYLLHEKCANFPLQKRHALSTRILFLRSGKERDDISFFCYACKRMGSGFRYEDSKYIKLDMHCASLSSFRHRKIHPHTLFLTTIESAPCVGCNDSMSSVFSCTECEYSLCFSCATLPVVIKHRCDDHYLFLSSGEKASGKYWCEICEAETNPNKLFYTCHDCGVVCHIHCVIGDSLNVKPGLLSKGEEGNLEAVLNDHNSRPLCSYCDERCRFPMIYNYFDKNVEGTFCKYGCFRCWDFKHKYT